jgi:predicted Zn-dependent protease with MMP-like domain
MAPAWQRRHALETSPPRSRPSDLAVDDAFGTRGRGAGATPMDRTRFARLVIEVVNDLPDEFASRLANVEIVVEDEPSRAQLRSVGLDPNADTLLGLYEGVPLEERTAELPVLPDKISIFYRPLIETCAGEAEIRAEIRTTILHEVAHFFGIDDEDLESWGY